MGCEAVTAVASLPEMVLYAAASRFDAILDVVDVPGDMAPAKTTGVRLRALRVVHRHGGMPNADTPLVAVTGATGAGASAGLVFAAEVDRPAAVESTDGAVG